MLLLQQALLLQQVLLLQLVRLLQQVVLVQVCAARYHGISLLLPRLL